MGSEEVLADLAKEVALTGKVAATTAAHVEYLKQSSDSVWKKLESLDAKFDDFTNRIVAKVDSGIMCAVADRRLCDARFTALEVRQGVTTTRLATVIAGVFFALQLAVWLAQWGFARVMTCTTGVGP